MNRSRLPLPLVVGAPLLLLLGGGAVGWFTADGEDGTPLSDTAQTLPTSFDELAPLHPLHGAPTPLDTDESMVIGASAYFNAAGIDVSGGNRLEIPLTAGAPAVAVDSATLQPAPAVVSSPIVPRDAVAMDADLGVSPPTHSAVVLETVLETVPESADAEPATPDPLRVSTPFAAAGAFAALCDEVQAGNVPDALVPPAVRPTLAVLVNQPSTIAVSGTWADGTAFEKTTMVTLAAHDDEWQRVFTETGEQRMIVGCVSLPVDQVRPHVAGGTAQLRASVLAISANGQTELNATISLDVPAETTDPFFVDHVTITGRGEQRRIDGVLYPTVHVHYSFLSDAVVPVGAPLQPGQIRVFADHAFVEGADCAGWAGNQQGVDRTRSGRFSVTSERRNVTAPDQAVTVVDGDVYLDPTLPGGWEGSFCVRLLATDLQGDQRYPLALRGAPVRSPRTATYDVGVLTDDDHTADVTWTAASGDGCTPTTLLNGTGAQCEFSARWAPDGIVVRVTNEGGAVVIRVPVNTAYCNPDDPLDVGGGCTTGLTQTFRVSIGAIIQVVRNAAPGSLWDDPSNAWIVGSVT